MVRDFWFLLVWSSQILTYFFNSTHKTDRLRRHCDYCYRVTTIDIQFVRSGYWVLIWSLIWILGFCFFTVRLLYLFMPNCIILLYLFFEDRYIFEKCEVHPVWRRPGNSIDDENQPCFLKYQNSRERGKSWWILSQALQEKCPSRIEQ